MMISSSIKATTLDRRQVAIKVAKKLHRAIVGWGAKRGLLAYRVVTATDSFFEIFDPNSRKISYDFPEKIKASINKYQAEIKVYADETREMDHPLGVGSFSTIERRAPKRRGGHTCDCNGEMRSDSPIKRDINITQAGSGSQTKSARDGSMNRLKVDFLE